MALADPQGEPQDFTELLSFLTQEEQNSRDSNEDIERAIAIDAYYGNPYGDEVDGQSQVVTREVSSTIDFDLIAILRTVVSSDRVVQFEATDADLAEKADDAGKAIHYQFMRKQDGYRILHDWIKSGELEKNGVIKTWVEPRSKTIQLEVPLEAFEGTPDAPTINGMPVVSSEHINADKFEIDDFTGEAVPAAPMHRVTLRQPLPPVFLDAVVPNEEFGASHDARDLESAPYIYHAQRKSLSDLHKMGFEFDDNALWGDNPESRVISDARDSQRSGREYDTQRRGPMRQVWFREEYAFYDLNGDGIAERIKVERVGRTILFRGGKPAIEEMEDQPFEEWCPYPMPARRVGQSLADKCLDVQRVNTTLERQALNSLYLSTNPRTLIHEDAIGDNTIDDLLTVRSGALIRYTGGTVPAPWATLPVHDQAFQGMQMMNDQLESRTGVTRLNQGLDIDTFDRTASGTKMIQSAGETLQEYRARNFVEALRRLFAKKYRLMRQFGEPMQIMVNGKPKTVNPREWPEEMDVKVNVGLGTGNRDKRIAYFGQVMESQIEGLQSGSKIVTWDNAYNTARAMVADMNIGEPSDFVTRPQAEDPNAPPPPDPEAIKAQGEAQAAQAKVQSEHEQAMGKLTLQQQAQQASDALKSQANEADLAAKRERNALDIELARQKASFEAELAERQQAFEMNLAERRFLFDQEMARAKHEQADQGGVGLTNYREGGSLSA